MTLEWLMLRACQGAAKYDLTPESVMVNIGFMLRERETIELAHLICTDF